MSHPVCELVATRLREFLRQPEAIFWVYGFPLLLAVFLGLAFQNHGVKVLRLGLLVQPSGPLKESLDADPSLQFQVLSESEGRKKLTGDQIDVLLLHGNSEKPTFVVDAQRPRSLLARERLDAAIQRAEGRVDPVTTQTEILDEPGNRYIDFLFPGLIAINLLSGGLYGIGFVIVDMRVRKLLKRFLATPMRRRDFFLSILTSRLFFLVPEMAFLLLIATLGFGMPIKGNLLALLAIIVLAALCFAGLGMLVSSRARRIETISGLIKLVIIVMWLLGGVFFGAERFPESVQAVIQLLPLNATTTALRAVILDGSSLVSQSTELLVLGVWGAVSFLLSARLFRWI